MQKFNLGFIIFNSTFFFVTKAQFYIYFIFLNSHIKTLKILKEKCFKILLRIYKRLVSRMIAEGRMKRMSENQRN